MNVGRTIKYISMTCDDLTLAVVYEDSDGLWVGCIDVRYFENTVGLFDQKMNFKMGFKSILIVFFKFP